jgi:hypothetical protein
MHRCKIEPESVASHHNSMVERANRTFAIKTLFSARL